MEEANTLVVKTSSGKVTPKATATARIKQANTLGLIGENARLHLLQFPPEQYHASTRTFNGAEYHLYWVPDGGTDCYGGFAISQSPHAPKKVAKTRTSGLDALLTGGGAPQEPTFDPDALRNAARELFGKYEGTE